MLPGRDIVHPELSTRDGVVLIARALDVGYGGRAVAAGIDLTLKEGERLALLGRNGAGKSTFVRTLCGELPPVAGVLGINRDLVLEDGLGLVPQRVEIDPYLATTVREFVDLGLVGSPLRGRERRERVAKTLARLDLSALTLRDWRQLSGGQRQRCLLARAMVRLPSLLVLDEPTAALDSAGEREFLSAVESLAGERKLTVVLVTHDLLLARRFCPTAAWFHDGRAEVGPSAAIATRIEGQA